MRANVDMIKDLRCTHDETVGQNRDPVVMHEELVRGSVEAIAACMRANADTVNDLRREHVEANNDEMREKVDTKGVLVPDSRAKMKGCKATLQVLK